MLFTNFPLSFSSAVTNAVNDMQHFVISHETLVVGIITYGGGLLLLNMLENTVNKIDLRSTLPKLKFGSSEFTEEEIKLKFTTPLTIDANRIYPTLDQLETPYLVGFNLRSEILQYITTNSSYSIHISGIQELSSEWSDMFDKDVYVFKKRMR